MFKSILFDMDGLMVDTEKLYMRYFSSRLSEMGITLSKDVFRAQMGRGMAGAANYFIEEYKINKTTEEMLDFLNIPALLDEFTSDKKNIETMPGLFELIEQFRGRLSYAIATGSAARFRDFVVDTLELKGTVSAFVSTEDVVKGKPNPDIYLEAARRLGTPIEQCFVLEDAPAGVLAGKRAGAYVIAVPNEWTNAHNFDEADFVCSSLFEAAEHIETLLKPE
ncbi:MAG: HAD family hydrolase [Brevinema sp.]